MRDEIAKLHASLIGTRGITYTRSDGAPQKLTVADMLARRAALEIAYNPNDCVEVRWGAARGDARVRDLQAPPPPDQRRRWPNTAPGSAKRAARRADPRAAARAGRRRRLRQEQ